MTADLAILITLVPAAYLLGSVPFGIVFARLRGGVDPRSSGSRNIGATNVARTSGKAAGALTLAADMLKGALPTLAAFHLAKAAQQAQGATGLMDGASHINAWAYLVAAVGLAAFLGHIYPLFLRFKGGKGVATACGVMFVISPVATILSGMVFFIVVLLKRYVSLGSIISAATMPVFLSLFPKDKDYVLLGVLVAVFIIIKHKENIKRLAAGVENKI